MPRDNLVGSSRRCPKRGSPLSRSSQIPIGSVDPDALKIPARRAEFSLTENASSPFHAEPRHEAYKNTYAAWIPGKRQKFASYK